MKQKITNAEGVEEEIEVFSAEETQAKIDAEKATLEEKHKADLEAKTGEATKVAAEKAELEAKIQKMEMDGIKDDHPNFKVLKDALAKKDTEMAALKTEIDNDKKTRKSEAMDAEIKKLTKGDAELEKKIKLHLEKTLSGLPDGTPEERTIKLLAAMKLSDAGESGPGMFDDGLGGGGYHGGGEGSSTKVEFTAREKALGAKLGIKEEDYKKYGPKLGKKHL